VREGSELYWYLCISLTNCYLVPQCELFYLRCWFLSWPFGFSTDCCCDGAYIMCWLLW